MEITENMQTDKFELLTNKTLEECFVTDCSCQLNGDSGCNCNCNCNACNCNCHGGSCDMSCNLN